MGKTQAKTDQHTLPRMKATPRERREKPDTTTEDPKSNIPLELPPSGLYQVENTVLIVFPIYQHDQRHALAWMITTVRRE